MSWCSKFIGLEKTVSRGDGGHKKGISGCMRGYLNLKGGYSLKAGALSRLGKVVPSCPSGTGNLSLIRLV